MRGKRIELDSCPVCHHGIVRLVTVSGGHSEPYDLLVRLGDAERALRKGSLVTGREVGALHVCPGGGSQTFSRSEPASHTLHPNGPTAHLLRELRFHAVWPVDGGDAWPNVTAMIQAMDRLGARLRRRVEHADIGTTITELERMGLVEVHRRENVRGRRTGVRITPSGRAVIAAIDDAEVMEACR